MNNYYLNLLVDVSFWQHIWIIIKSIDFWFLLGGMIIGLIGNPEAEAIATPRTEYIKVRFLDSAMPPMGQQIIFSVMPR